MVFNKKIFDYLDHGPVEDSFTRLATVRQLSVYEHSGFWKAMDTHHEMLEMNEIWDLDRPWALWEK